MRYDHEDQQYSQIDREQAKRAVGGDPAEQRRHQRRAHIGACHLHADDGLGAPGPEVGGRGMDEARIDRGTAEADDDETYEAVIDAFDEYLDELDFEEMDPE